MEQADMSVPFALAPRESDTEVREWQGDTINEVRGVGGNMER
jgi:hypothetical protein